MQRHRSLLLPASTALVLILLTSVLQGRWTQRGEDTTSEELNSLAAAYEKIPLTVGDWVGERHEEQTSRRELEMAGAKGHLSATFTNPRTGQTVSVYMICGMSRDVSIHTPDACYPGAGFLMEGKTQQFPFRVGDHQIEFTTAVFTKSTLDGTQRLRLFWAWNAGTGWESPEWPRLRFGGRQALNKLYLISIAPPEEPIHECPSLAFASQFLPAVEQVLYPQGATAKP